jgi:A/G-specific adenine glycosylase
VASDVTPSPEQARLLGWAARQRRDLPWRRTRDPWSVLVSEVMLQQTQVDRVVPRWERFLQRWPTTSACAAAPLGDVLVEWQGLGYPRRARALHTAARQIEVVHEGRFPDHLEDLLALPGIGPYTARAVLAFAFERDVAVVDTNVGRVLARRHGVVLGARRAQEAADRWVPAGEGWAWNQGLLDVGALHCRPRVPRCEGCPVSETCTWFLAGRPEPDPAKGSAAVSRRQARFEGSARQARGRLMAALGAGPVALDDVATVAQLTDRPEPDGAVAELVDGLVRDGLVERGDGELRLPG